MKITRLSMKNFRGIYDLTLELNNMQSIVLIGINGVGKSSILDCISQLLSGMLCDIIGNILPPVFDGISDITSGCEETSNLLTISLDNQIGSVFHKMRLGGASEFSVQFQSLSPNANGQLGSQLGQDIRSRIEAGKLPLAVHYSVDRAVFEIPLDQSFRTWTSPSEAYSESLLGGQANFQDFFEWFRNREDLENEIRRDTSEFRDRQLEAVRTAISHLLPGFVDLRIRRFQQQMIVRKDGESIAVNQLSDGEKCLLAMSGDLARRLAIANTGLEDPLQGTGVVLIDEIELHLHPNWQYEIIPALTRTFPNCQFIVTTHSPIVLSQVKPEGIFCLEKDKDGKLIAYHPDSSYGRDVNQIVEDLMGVPSRPVKFQQKILELFRLIDAGNLDGAKQKREELANEIGADEPELVKANVSIRRKEILNK
jgi:predicted ATP-binding protein involved in virulence